MISNPNLRYYLNIYKAKGIKIPLYLRITLKRKKAEIATKYFFERKEWNELNQCVRNNGDINEDLEATKAKVYEVVKTLERSKKHVTAQIIKEIITGKNKIDATLLDSFERYIQRLRSEVVVRNETVSMFNATKKHVLKFLQKKRITDIMLENIDYIFLSDFDLFLLKQPVNTGTTMPFSPISTMARNTVNKHHSRLRTILIRAIKEGYIQRNPYMDFKLKKVPSSRTFLTEEELKNIMEHSLGDNDSLKKVRDIFIFSVYSGLRFEDAQKVKMDAITKDKNSKYTLRVKQEKTDEYIAIPLLAPAMEIINKYKNAPERKIFNNVLPKLSNQKVNAYLKVIGDLCGIQKKLTHHVARHTCATTILLSNDIPIEAVSKWLGHTNIKTTQVYAKITNQYLQKEADKLEGKV